MQQLLHPTLKPLLTPMLGSALAFGLGLASFGCGGGEEPAEQSTQAQTQAQTQAGSTGGGEEMARSCPHGGPGGGHGRGHGRGGHGRGHGHGGGGHGGGGHGRGGGGRGGRGGGGGPPSDAVRGDFHSLLDDHTQIRRRVELRPFGVESWTTSEDPEVAERIRRHVREIYAHLEGGGRVRMWDPLFAAMVEHASEMELEVEPIEGGVHVTHRGQTPEAVRLIQAHARVVEGFVARGQEEARQEHAVPAAGSTEPAEEASGGATEE